MQVGNGADAGVDIGPMVSKDALNRAVDIIDQVCVPILAEAAAPEAMATFRDRIP